MIGRVYKVEVNENDFYIGSTIKSLEKRETKHNFDLRKNVNKCKLYEECRKNNITKIICILLEEREIKETKEIRILEDKYIKELQPSLNERSAYTTEEDKKEYDKEYKENNREDIYKKNREYYINNREKISKQKKEYREKKLETITEYKKQYYINNREKISKQKKEYREKNLETINEYSKQYYDNNKDTINKKQKEPINCPICNSIVCKGSIARHQKTIKCLSYKTI